MEIPIIKTQKGYRVNGKTVIKDREGHLIPLKALTDREKESLNQHLLSL